MKTSYLILMILFVGKFIFASESYLYDSKIKPLIEVQKNGKGNKEASKAWLEVANLPVEKIPLLLTAMNQANNLGDNWIRAAISKIAEKSESAIPLKEIIRFLKDYKNEGDSRMEALNLIRDYDPEKANLLIPSFIDDPVSSLRREAVSVVILDAQNQSSSQKKIKLYNYALEKARDADQITQISNALKEEGININLVDLMGFSVNWKSIGPFDNTARQGFSKVYPPEKKIDFKKTYRGKTGSTSWSTLNQHNEMGLIDINLKYGEIKEALVYAHTKFPSETNQNVHFRIGSKNAWKLWVNGELIFARDEYHRGKTRIDQFVIKGKLNEGLNDILLKVCQNEQTQSWTKQWEFNFRITDTTGSPLRVEI